MSVQVGSMCRSSLSPVSFALGVSDSKEVQKAGNCLFPCISKKQKLYTALSFTERATGKKNLILSTLIPYREANCRLGHRENKRKKKWNQVNQILVCWSNCTSSLSRLSWRAVTRNSFLGNDKAGLTGMHWSQRWKMLWQCCEDRANINDIAKYVSLEWHYSKTLSFLQLCWSIGLEGTELMCHISDKSQKGMFSLWGHCSWGRSTWLSASAGMSATYSGASLSLQGQKEPVF